MRMPRVKFISHAGEERTVDAAAGTTVMQAAVDNDIEGIVAECGGSCSCATCHCYVEESWLAKLEPPSDVERDMLECVLAPQSNSRLSCQIKLTEALDGIAISVPENQY
jgi:2Fe-2S ferredoxin